MSFSVPLRALLAALMVSMAVNALSIYSVRLQSSARVWEQPLRAATISMSVTSGKKRRFWTRLKASNTWIETKKISVKKRARVSLDRETGKITEISPAPSIDNGNKMNPWKAFKRTLYGTVDAVRSVRRRTGKDTSPARPVDGYSSTIEKTVLKSPSSSSGERLMKEYQERVLETTTEKSTDLFDTVKGSIYITLDGISSIFKPEETKPASPLKSETFKPVVKPTLASSPQVKDALPDLKSNSPGKRWLAELKIRNWEEEQRRRKRELERQQASEKFKEAVYSFGDAALLFVKLLADLPARLSETAEATMEWFSTVPVALENTVTTITSIPDKVNTNVEQVQAKVETSIETTKKVVEDVQTLPTKIQETVKDTKRNVDETITNVKILVGAEEKKPVPPQVPPPKPRTAEELAWDLAGGAATVTGKAAWFVSVGAAKLSFAGAKFAFHKISEKMAEQRAGQAQGMETVVASTGTTVMETPNKVVESAEKEVTVIESPASRKPASSKPKSSFGSFFGNTKTEKKDVSQKMETVKTVEMEALDREVADALALAEKAMKMADEDIISRKKKNGKSELDVALRKAREAAVIATQQAVEIEQNSLRP